MKIADEMVEKALKSYARVDGGLTLFPAAMRAALEAVAQPQPFVSVEALCSSPLIEILTPTAEDWLRCETIQDRYDMMKRRIRAALFAQVRLIEPPLAGLIADAWEEAQKAMRKFPQPNYVISKVAEEAGEVVKAAIHCAEGRETPENVRAEIKQAIAMLMRLFVEGDQVHGLAPIAQQDEPRR